MYQAHKPTVGTYAKDRTCQRCGIALPNLDAIMWPCSGEMGDTRGVLGDMGVVSVGDKIKYDPVRRCFIADHVAVPECVVYEFLHNWRNPDSHDEWRSMNDNPVGYVEQENTCVVNYDFKPAIHPHEWHLSNVVFLDVKTAHESRVYHYTRVSEHDKKYRVDPFEKAKEEFARCLAEAKKDSGLG